MSLDSFPESILIMEEIFQNQLDFYLEHNKRAFSYFDFHTQKSVSSKQEKAFERKLRWCLYRSGFEISKTMETFPPIHIVSKMEEYADVDSLTSTEDFSWDELSDE